MPILKLSHRSTPYVLSFLAGAALAVVASCAATGCTSSAVPPHDPVDEGRVDPGPGPSDPRLDPPTKEAAKDFAGASNAFAIDLYGTLRDKPGNVIVSPASVAMAMAIPWAGARGKTSDEIKKVFHFGGAPDEIASSAAKLSAELQDPKRPLVLRIANQLYGEQSAPFESPFLELVGKGFGAPLAKVDFKRDFEGARASINGWVLEKTEKKIADLIPSGALSDLTRLVIVNAVYFHGDWEQTFPKDATRKSAFFAPSGERQADMMHAPERQYGYAEADGLKAVSMDYKGGSMSMVVLLPSERDGLPALEKALTTEKLDAVIGMMGRRAVNVTLPKFKIAPSEALALGPTLAGLGMATAFDPRASDFTGISNPSQADERIHIDKVFHKAFIEVDEKGTEAAAATGIGMNATTSVHPPAAEFVADHPFLFVLRDNASGLVLFMGRVTDPTEIH
ncbi:MAG: serpin family protein [Polyangiaceae bacterium]